MGWYTEETGGSLVSDISEHTVTAETETYYAHWGWKPRFQTDGGSFVTAPAYTTQVGNSNYNLGTLPEVEREYYVFLGWYIGDTKVEDNQIVDLANGCVFTARWKQKKVVAVKLDPNGGSYTSNGVTVYTEQVYTNVYYGKKIGELPTPVKDSSDFEGWYDGDTKYT